MDCPICMSSIVEGTEASRKFPCGHVLCSTCDDNMVMRNQHRCPMCRRPRQGFTEAEANQAAEDEVQMEREREAMARSAGVSGSGVLTRIVHGGRNYEVMFFADEAEGDPTEILRAMARRTMDAIGHSNASQAQPEVVENYQPGNAEINVNVDLESFNGNYDEQTATQVVQQLRDGNYIPIDIAGPIGGLIGELVRSNQPISNFTRRREEVRQNSGSARNVRPRRL